MADDVLRQGVQGITDLITVPGLINLDFADVRTIMQDAGHGADGHRHGGGREPRRRGRPRRHLVPLLESSVEGATGILLNITGGADLGLFEVNEAAEIVASAADQNANIIFGAVIDEQLGDHIRVTVIATGFETAPARAEPCGPPTEPSSRRSARGDFDAQTAGAFEIPATCSTSRASCATELPSGRRERRAAPASPCPLRWRPARRGRRPASRGAPISAIALGAARLELADELDPGAARARRGAAYSSSFCARVGDVEVAHRQLPDAVERAERRVRRCAP